MLMFTSCSSKCSRLPGMAPRAPTEIVEYTVPALPPFVKLLQR